ncbi:hypothetical protein B0H67DRAFT_563319 [Lasiosphaeris hirsuta]|uniref:Heparan-alpha-glucosaminide N-acetyltransferase catalytic domain-containing protein n=1 Tax=Lasiosphaeris hirsuta TaxID=260670 RepID=A0AA40ED33_9PEZI|nr:hypothetical protein B0H67DRAFT_563319 [Lasiosphaeris hirsuta]
MKDRDPAPADTVPIPLQPDPAVQETTFAADTAADLVLLEHEAIPDNDNGPSRTAASYGAIASLASLKPHTPSPSRALAPDLLRGLLMLLMALDHNALALHAWPHGTAYNTSEVDSVPLTAWNRPIAYIIRTLTHFCAPGFIFLLGMGVVYFGRSRTSTRLNWSVGRMIRHFVARTVVLVLVSEAMGLIASGGKTWFFNIVLVALAVDYLVAGLVWLATRGVERRVAGGLLKVLPEDKGDEARRPLLRRDVSEGEGGIEDAAPDRAIIRAADVSWHALNVALLATAGVAIWWNVWLSPTGGHCGVQPVPMLPDSVWARFWFYGLEGPHVISVFPPMAWFSFAILGLIYGRIILARSWSAAAITAGNALAGASFSLIFVLTRLLRFGNLSEGCLQAPEHIGYIGNPYLASPASFFYITKYPPDVAFWAFSMAGNFFLLALFSAIPPRIASKAFHVLLVFGTSALFFYVVHIFMLFGSGAIVVAWLGHDMDSKDPLTGGPGYGVDQLWAYFGNWVLCLVALYPLCRWYGGFKKTREPDSIWRFF